MMGKKVSLITQPKVFINDTNVSFESNFSISAVLVRFNIKCWVEQTLPSNWAHKKNDKNFFIIDVTQRDEIKSGILFNYYGKCLIKKITFYTKQDQGINPVDGIITTAPTQIFKNLKGTFNSMKDTWESYDWDGRNDWIMVSKLVNKPLNPEIGKYARKTRIPKMVKIKNPKYREDIFFPHVGNLITRKGLFKLNGEDYEGDYHYIKRNKASYVGKGPDGRTRKELRKSLLVRSTK